MALVAYDNSDSSDYEDDDNQNTNIVPVVNNKTESKTSLKLPEPVQKQDAPKIEEVPASSADTGQNLFNLLPQPSRRKPAVVEEDDEFLHKKEEPNGVKPKAKITVPSLSDFKDVETSTPASKPKVPNGKKSGLLSMLPQPKNGVRATTTSLIPKILTVKKPVAAPAIKKATILKSQVNGPLINDYSDESDNEDVQNDFFSINKPVELMPDVEIPLELPQSTVTQQSEQKPKGIEAFFKKEEINHVQLEPDYEDYSSNSMGEQSDASSSQNGYGYDNASSSNEMVLDEEAIRQLCGSRGKRKREEIQIVDVNQQDVLADAREMLLKGLMDDTTKRVSVSKKKGNEPTSQQKRKHQITYLAYQAKANEADLQNQWANNRMSKRQTQAKYGF